MARIRLLFAEDEGTLRTTLVRLLGEFPDLEIVAACANGRDALIEALAHRPEVVLTDLRMPRMDGIELTRALREKLPETAVVILTAYDDDESLFAALKAGARGYVLKDATLEEILAAIRVAREGQGVLSSGLVRRVIEEFTRVDRMIRGQRQLFAQLTPREMEVLEALAEGLANRQIAERLHLSPKTVRNYISTILEKLQANDRTEAALIAARHGLGHPETETPSGSGDDTGPR